MDYTEVRFYNSPEWNEILIALLAEADFDMFEEKESGVFGYIPSEKYHEDKVREMLMSNPALSSTRFESSIIKDRNWNTEWEKNFEPVLVAGRVFIRAPFHSPGNYPYEIIIEPKMSFGTGHHATTALMIELMLQIQMEDKTVLDMGCGSGVLAIFAEQNGAKKIIAIDNDEWAYENSLENIARNHCKKIEVKKGNASLIGGEKFDIILANINRNVLLSDMEKYVDALNLDGDILLSGILLEDRQVIRETAEKYGLKHIISANHENWAAIYFKK